MLDSVKISLVEAIGVAKEALDQDETEQSVQYQGRNYKHWSYYLLVTGAIIGGAAAIAAAVMGITTLIVASSLLFISNAIGAYYISRFDTYNDLEDYADVLNDKVHQLADHLIQYDRQNDRYEEVNNEYEDLIEDDIELNQRLGKNVKEWERNLEKAQQKKQEAILKLSEENEKLRLQLEQTRTTYKAISEKNTQLIETINQFVVSSKKYGKKSRLFKGRVKSLKKVKKEMEVLVDKLQAIESTKCDAGINYNEAMEQMSTLYRHIKETSGEMAEYPQVDTTQQQQFLDEVTSLLERISRIVKVLNERTA